MEEETSMRLAGAWTEDDDDPFQPLAWSVVETATRPRVAAVRPCVHCGGRLLPSHARWYDRLRRRVTRGQPYRCAVCRNRCWQE